MNNYVKPIPYSETIVISWQHLITSTCKITFRAEGEDNDIGPGEVLHRKVLAQLEDSLKKKKRVNKQPYHLVVISKIYTSFILLCVTEP